MVKLTLDFSRKISKVSRNKSCKKQNLLILKQRANGLILDKLLTIMIPTVQETACMVLFSQNFANTAIIQSQCCKSNCILYNPDHPYWHLFLHNPYNIFRNQFHCLLFLIVAYPLCFFFF